MQYRGEKGKNKAKASTEEKRAEKEALTVRETFEGRMKKMALLSYCTISSSQSIFWYSTYCGTARRRRRKRKSPIEVGRGADR